MGYIVFSIFILVIDIMTKLVAELGLKNVETIPLWENVFHLTYVENRGIAFGMFSDARVLFIILSFVILIVLAFLYSKISYRTKWLKVGTALIYGGAIGNLMERLAKGYVVDFFDFRLINFPVFNMADIAVCVGAAMMMIHFFVSDKAEEKAKLAAQALAEQEAAALAAQETEAVQTGESEEASVHQTPEDPDSE